MRTRALAALLVAACSTSPAPSPAPAPSDAPPPASWLDGAVARIRVDRENMRGCKGGLTAQSQAHFRKIYAEALACAGRYAFEGTVTFHVTVEDGGGLSEFSGPTEDAPKDVVECIREGAFAHEYPKGDPQKECAEMYLPMTFP